MKLSYSIKNWGGRSWNEFCEAAKDTHLGGVEICNVQDRIFQGKNSPTNPELAGQTRRYLSNHNLTIPCLDTAVDFTHPGSEKK